MICKGSWNEDNESENDTPNVTNTSISKYKSKELSTSSYTIE